MENLRTPVVFDGHNDTLLTLELRAGTTQERSFFEEAEYDHIDLPRAQKGGFAGGFFALFVPPEVGDEELLNTSLDWKTAGTKPRIKAPKERQLDQHVALDFTMRMIDRAEKIADPSKGQVQLCKSASAVKTAISNNQLAMVLHMEGAEAIDADFEALDLLYDRGVRSIGPVWSRKNLFGHGIALKYGQGPDDGPGLTELGRELVRRCNDKKIMLDVSHMNEQSFWDLAAATSKPIVATHSNAFACSPVSRNLTDQQLSAIAESGGLVGVNFSVPLIRTDGQKNSETPIEDMIRHFDYLLEKLGEDGVAIGSDFDGCICPQEIGDVTGLPKLADAFAVAGYGQELIEKILHVNWINMLEEIEK